MCLVKNDSCKNLFFFDLAIFQELNFVSWRSKFITIFQTITWQNANNPKQKLDWFSEFLYSGQTMIAGLLNLKYSLYLKKIITLKSPMPFRVVSLFHFLHTYIRILLSNAMIAFFSCNFLFIFLVTRINTDGGSG